MHKLDKTLGWRTVWGILLLLMGTAFSAGCTIFEIHLIPPLSGLKEKVVSGAGPNKVLMVPINGVISNQKSKGLMSPREKLGMVENIQEILNLAEKDPQIKAVLLRINSPGGTVTSSDIIYHELKTFKQKRRVKVYAQVMDLAASGGYYVAQAADTIIAHPTSITGSIGVISLKVNLEKLMDKVGVEFEVIKSGDKKDFLSPFRSLSVEERKLFQATIDSMHERFVNIIAENRSGLNLDQVKQLADGRIYTSKQALNSKLIDHIAYMDQTQELIKRDLGVSQIKVVTYYRAGEYKENVYSSMNPSPTINIVNIDLNFLPKSPEPQFLYLWIP